MAGERVLVPVAESQTLRETVGYAVGSALDGASADDPAVLRFVYIHSLEATDESEASRERAERADDLLSRVSLWAEEDAGDRADEIRVETAAVGQRTYLFSPSDIADVLEDQIRDHGTDRIVLDPEYDPGTGVPLLHPLEVELARGTSVAVEEAPVERPARRVPILRRAPPASFGVLFGVAFVFYQVLAGQFAAFDVVTGAVSGTVVAAGLSRVSLNRRPDWQSPMRILRGIIYVPYLFYEILLANLVVSAAILLPGRRIDPRMTRVRAAVTGPLPVTTLANSITLTPGTLTVRVRGQNLVVHTLLPWAKDGLFDGSLERAVRFVFYGRDSATVPTPRERGDTEILQPPDGGPEAADASGTSADAESGGGEQ